MGVVLVSRGGKITGVSSRANLKVTTTYNVDIQDGFSQLARVFVTKMVDSDGLKWTQLDRGTGVWSQLGASSGQFCSEVYCWFCWLGHVVSSLVMFMLYHKLI